MCIYYLPVQSSVMSSFGMLFNGNEVPCGNRPTVIPDIRVYWPNVPYTNQPTYITNVYHMVTKHTYRPTWMYKGIIWTEKMQCNKCSVTETSDNRMLLV